MPDKTAPQRVARYTQAQRAKGFRKVSVWVRSDEHAERIKRLAAEMRQEPDTASHSDDHD